MHISNIPSRQYPDTWYAASIRKWSSRKPLIDTHQSRVCVIGGGLAGLSVAIELLKQGKSVTVLEAGRVGWGASGRNGGIVSAGFSIDFFEIQKTVGFELACHLYRYSQLGVERVRENIESFAPDCLVGEGKYSVSRYPASAEMQAHVALLSETLGDDVEYLCREKLQEVIKSKRYFDGIYKPGGFHIQPLKYVQALANEIENRAGRIFETTKAIGIVPVTDKNALGRWIVKTAQGSVLCEHIVVCTSGYDAGFFRPLSQSVLPIATHVVVTEPLDDSLSGLINTSACISDTGNACDYYRLIDDNRLLWGGKITTLKSPPGSLNQKMHRSITNVFPQMSRVKIEYGWSGLMGYCRHKMPVLLQQRPGIWVATAFGGHGLNTTAMAGELISTAITQDDFRYKDFAAYDLRWNGGPIGRMAVQASYWKMQIKDRIAEFRGQQAKR